MKKSFAQIYQEFNKKAALIEQYQSEPLLFQSALESALNDKASEAWRAIWFINNINRPALENELLNVYPQLIKRLEEDDSSLQRELLRLMQNISLLESWESYLFDRAQKIWENIGKIPSARIQALYCLFKIAAKHPELKNEIALYQEEYYLQDLSPGIKRQALSRLAKLI